MENSMIDYRALCAELLESTEKLYDLMQYAIDGYYMPDSLTLQTIRLSIERTRAALAQPESVEPTDEELLKLLSRASGLPDHDTYIINGGKIISEPSNLLSFARDILARWGCITPQTELVQPTDEELREIWFLEEWVNEGASLGTFISIARSVLTRWNRTTLAQPEPVGPTAKQLADTYWDAVNTHKDRKNVVLHDVGLRAILTRYGRPAITPIPMSEQLPGPEDCDAEGRCWVGSAAFTDDTDYGPVDYSNGWELCHFTPGDDCWLPANDLPLPKGGAA
jgi:hypothetical protein